MRSWAWNVRMAVSNTCLWGMDANEQHLDVPVLILFFHIKYLLDNNVPSTGLDPGVSVKSKTSPPGAYGLWLWTLLRPLKYPLNGEAHIILLKYKSSLYLTQVKTKSLIIYKSYMISAPFQPPPCSPLNSFPPYYFLLQSLSPPCSLKTEVHSRFRFFCFNYLLCLEYSFPKYPQSSLLHLPLLAKMSPLQWGPPWFPSPFI